MKVIFLDIDGVLNSQETFRKVREHFDATGEWLVEIDDEMVKRLARIVRETSAEIVLSSSWRNFFDTRTLTPHNESAQGLVDSLEKHNLKIISRTGRSSNGNRGDEIKAWLSKHTEVKNFVILDDESSDLQDFVDKELVKTSFTAPSGMVKDMSDCTGLQEKHVIQAIRILNGDDKND